MQSLDVPHRCSKVIKAVYLLTTCVCFTLIVLLPALLWAKCLAFAILLVAVALVWRNLAQLNNLERIQMDDDGLVLIVGGKARSARLVGEVFVNELLVAFSCEFDDVPQVFRRLQVIVLADSMAAEDRRQLRLELKARSSR